MSPLLILGAIGACLTIFGKQAGAAIDASGAASTTTTSTDPERDAPLHDEIIPMLNSFLPGTAAVAGLLGEDTVEDISDFFARVDDANRTNIENLSNDLAKFDDNVREVTTKIFAPVTRLFDRWF